ncbi:Sister chromatid cohesion protein [Dioscorea alata]|uniref:Sister chromatid cohesion protein n=1 Tax=Dioscorea alata TaxID=55571 RepID=A0ACB7UUT9_DIOAL|nr:Sister chromatid cohesion protein [Dioscorea alata]
MIVRTYTRRSRGLPRSHSDPNLLADDDDPAAVGEDDHPEPFLSQGSGSQVPIPLFFSSQDSSPWSLDHPFDLPPDECPEPSLPFSKESNGERRKGRGLKRGSGGEVKNGKGAATATLMEAQEFGEMMEHVDEVNFALDGLRPGQPARIRRASLLSLLSICETTQQRRLLRTQGMAKKIIDAVLGLNLDDSPSTIAAAALFFVLASDAQDDHLLDSPSCICFLLKLLNIHISDTVNDKIPTFGHKLLGIRKPQVEGTSMKGLDSSSSAIMSKVHAILLNCKELKSGNEDDDVTGRPELSSKWISLLTMEKACLSTVSFEDTPDTVRRVGGTFKEKLREFGGLDAISDVISSCFSTMEIELKHTLHSVRDIKDGAALQCAVLLLKCLKIMENATFLSKDNQRHLLGMKSNMKSGGLPLSFVGMIISFIKLLSGLSRHQSSWNISKKLKPSNCPSERTGPDFSPASENQLKKHLLDNHDQTSSCDHVGRSSIEVSPGERINACLKRQRLSICQSEESIPNPGMTLSAGTDVYSIKRISDSTTSGLSNGVLTGSNGESHKNATGLSKSDCKSSNGWISIKAIGSKRTLSGLSRKPHVSEDVKGNCMKDTYDPFAFDEDDMEPSKWELLAKKKEPMQTLQISSLNKVMDESDIKMGPIDHELSQVSDRENHITVGNSSLTSIEEDSTLIEDCLLTAIKVLMNLTNDNPIGCRQIATCGGLETLASLILSHFPSFGLSCSTHSQLKDTISSSSSLIEAGQLKNKHLNDHELEFLVAILGLLVNLVEKDSQNRSRLVSAQVSVEEPGILEESVNDRDVIPLLCSIFLANQGSGEGAGDESPLLCDDEASLLQGEREAEMMIIQAYAALLLAFLSTESSNAREAIAKCLPNHNLRALVPVLERFVAFHLSLNMISPETHSAVNEVIESCKEP